jgi:Uma2 family endonuclease
MPEPQADRRYTYGDYVTWPEGERWELIEGRAYAMTPAPMVRHQQLLLNLIGLMLPYFGGKPCRLFVAPLDVRLPEEGEGDDTVETVVQPDLLVVCDPAKVDERGVRGAPDLVVEILSESTAARDLSEKLRLYEKHGVRCYIIADPWGKTLTLRTLEAPGKFGRAELFDGATQAPIRIFEGLSLDLAQVFSAI